MARTPSTMLPLGTTIPSFALTDQVSKVVIRPEDAAGLPILVIFICNHCPFVLHLRAGLAKFGADYGQQGLTIIAINSNDVEAFPDDSPAKMMLEANNAGYNFPYCWDHDQSVAKAFHAACTPDFFLFDRQHKLVYRGQFDDSRPKGLSAAAVTGADLRAAADSVLYDQPMPSEQKPSMGCNIKWKAGKEPEYFTV